MKIFKADVDNKDEQGKVKIKRIPVMFGKHLKNSAIGFFGGLIPRTVVIEFSDPKGFKHVNVSREWLGEILRQKTYTLNEKDEFVLQQHKEIARKIYGLDITADKKM